MYYIISDGKNPHGNSKENKSHRNKNMPSVAAKSLTTFFFSLEGIAYLGPINRSPITIRVSSNWIPKIWAVDKASSFFWQKRFKLSNKGGNIGFNSFKLLPNQWYRNHGLIYRCVVYTVFKFINKTTWDSRKLSYNGSLRRRVFCCHDDSASKKSII